MTRARATINLVPSNGNGLDEGSVPELIVTIRLKLGSGPVTPQTQRITELIERLASSDDAAAVTSIAPEASNAPGVSTAPEASNAPRSSVAPGSSLAPPASVAAPVDHDPEQVTVYPAARTVLLGATEVPLTRREFDLLLCLAENPVRVFTRAQLLAKVWGNEFTGQRSVDVHVLRLRAKLGMDVPLVMTLRGVGYRLHGDAKVTVVQQG